MTRARLWLVVALGAALGACAQDGLRDDFEPLQLDIDYHRCFVQPVVAARCAFMECHGSATQPYRTYAVQRMRLEVPWTELNVPLTDAELAANYNAALGFAGDATNDPLLLIKPLDVDAGGFYHGGKYQFGTEDVFTSDTDRGYVLLRDWIDGAVAAPACEPTREVGL